METKQHVESFSKRTYILWPTETQTQMEEQTTNMTIPTGKYSLTSAGGEKKRILLQFTEQL